jgi:hypothetical protein
MDYRRTVRASSSRWYETRIAHSMKKNTKTFVHRPVPRASSCASWKKLRSQGRAGLLFVNCQGSTRQVNLGKGMKGVINEQSGYRH